MEPFLFAVLGGLFIIAIQWLIKARLSFVAQRPEDYAESDQTFDIREVLNGPIICEGVIYGPTGRVSSRFVGDFEAEWKGNAGIMREVFTYDSGNTQNRAWYLTLDDSGRIEARADDVEGVGTGFQKGNAVQLQYRLRLPEEGGGHVLDVTDWMYLAPNGTIINRSQFRKFGIQVAELVATMRPAEELLREAA
ncbi:MAG: DUF3833 family protein [Arenibacterium sp.]